MSPEERESIINEAVERTLLKIPEVVGTLMATYAGKIKDSKEFYDNHPEFKDHRDIVAAVIEDLENKNFGKSVKELAAEAVPVIRKRIEQTRKLSNKVPEVPKLDFNGVI
jgi:hypothetical protein